MVWWSYTNGNTVDPCRYNKSPIRTCYPFLFVTPLGYGGLKTGYYGFYKIKGNSMVDSILIIRRKTFTNNEIVHHDYLVNKCTI